ncbi:hypothetical protein [Bacillus subtilis]|uniref:hypothetical protein n=1 Tax=Bacillus subtilis TaxID=1423 RepID=UPI0018A7B552|nr:hypothetical protein [Bacillus subtilis]MBF8201648.1 hypothetical protein [Bacillus subtilis]
MNKEEMVDIIKCPHCKHKMDYDPYLDVCDMSGEFDMDCEKCKKTFNVNFYSMFYFTTKKLEGVE